MPRNPVRRHRRVDAEFMPSRPVHISLCYLLNQVFEFMGIDWKTSPRFYVKAQAMFLELSGNDDFWGLLEQREKHLTSLEEVETRLDDMFMQVAQIFAEKEGEKVDEHRTN